MIRHTVLFKLKPNVSKQDVERVFTDIMGLVSELPESYLLLAGLAFSTTKKGDRVFTHGFSIDFADPRARDSFLNESVTHPVKNTISSVAAGGHQGIIGFDFGIWS